MHSKRQLKLNRYRLMARLRAEGESLAAIGKRLGVSRQCVHEALKGLQRRAAFCQRCGAELPTPRGAAKDQDVLCPRCLVHSAEAPFGRRLYSLRIAAGFTQAELARRTQHSQAGIARLEKGEHQPSLRTRAHLLTYLQGVLGEEFAASTPSSRQERRGA